MTILPIINQPLKRKVMVLSQKRGAKASYGDSIHVYFTHMEPEAAEAISNVHVYAINY